MAFQPKDYISYTSPLTRKRTLAVIVDDNNDGTYNIAEYNIDKKQLHIEKAIRADDDMLNLTRGTVSRRIPALQATIDALKLFNGDVPKCVHPIANIVNKVDSGTISASTTTVKDEKDVKAIPETPQHSRSKVKATPETPNQNDYEAKLREIKRLMPINGRIAHEFLDNLPSGNNKYVDTKPTACTIKKSKSMCMFYKAISPLDKYQKNSICNSCVLHMLEDGREVFRSSPAEWMHMSLLGDPDFRLLSVTDANTQMKKMALCTKCREDELFKVHEGEFINVIRNTEICALCKGNGKSYSSGDGPRLCNPCHRNISGERSLYIMLETFRKVFSKMEVIVSDTRKAKTKSGYFPDAQVRVLRAPGETVLLFIIEQDENKHSKKGSTVKDGQRMEKTEAENVKMLSQTAEMLVSMFKSMSKDEYDKVKVVMVRWSPTGSYRVSNKDHGEAYSKEYRLIVLRQWLIWAVLNAKELGRMTMWYMYYDNTDKNRKLLLFNKWPGFAMINEAPAPENPEWEWKYCLVPYEGDTRACTRTSSSGDTGKHFNKMIERRVRPQDVFNGNWRFQGVNVDFGKELVKLIEEYMNK